MSFICTVMCLHVDLQELSDRQGFSQKLKIQYPHLVLLDSPPTKIRGLKLKHIHWVYFNQQFSLQLYLRICMYRLLEWCNFNFTIISPLICNNNFKVKHFITINTKRFIAVFVMFLQKGFSAIMMS